jgi:hypothetical protein
VRERVARAAPRTSHHMMPTPQTPPPDDEVPVARLLVWITIAVILALGLWLFMRYGREVAPLIAS